MGSDKKFAFFLILLAGFFFATFLKPQMSLAGACNEGEPVYNPHECQVAKNNADGLNCEFGGYAYYSCNKVGDIWKYCWGCHVSSGGGCFPPGTIVKTPTGGTPIQNVKVGDAVTSFDDQSGKVLQSKVTDLHAVTRTFYFSIIAGGYHVTVTAEHPFFVGDGKYKEAQDLKTGDVLYVEQNNVLAPTVVAANIRIDKPTSAYNLTVDNTHTFFANGFAVHNKGCVCGSYKITDCAKADNCQGKDQGDFCGYDKRGNKKYYCTTTFCNTCPSCNTTAPSNVAVTAVSPTRATVTWTPGANGVSQSVYAASGESAYTRASSCALLKSFFCNASRTSSNFMASSSER